MSTTPYGFVARIEAKPDKSQELSDLLTGALSLAQAETGTVRWHAAQTDPTCPAARCRARARGTRNARPVLKHATNSRRKAPRPWTYNDRQIASWEIRMDPSSGKSTGSRWAICSGLHAIAHRRSRRRPLLRPFHCGAAGPATGDPSARRIIPASRSATYWCSAGLIASLAGLGRRAINSDFHCATDARYAKDPLRVAALRRSSREIVDGARPILRAILRTPKSWAFSNAISSRSTNDKYRLDKAVSCIDGMPPRSLNQREPTGPDTPHAAAASSLVNPCAILTQNARSTSRRIGGHPGERIAGRPVRVVIHPEGLPI